jgi:hypothetical protein
MMVKPLDGRPVPCAHGKTLSCNQQLKNRIVMMRNTRVEDLTRAGTRLPLLLLLLLLLASQTVWAEVRATLNRSTIQGGDTVTLVIEASGKDPGGQPDLSVLEQDFEILGTSTSQQIQFINGKRSGRRQWEIELAPLHAGVIEVPAVSVGSERTSPLSLTVNDQPAPEAAAAAGEPVFLKAVIDPPDANIHVQQQFNYTLQLYFREPLLNGSFEGPGIDKALVQQLGEDVRYSTRVNGIEYQVVERRYAVFPEESGELVIPAVVFDGYLRSDSGRRMSVPGINTLLDDFMSGTPFGGKGKRIRVRSEPVTVQVNPRPSDYSGSTWLPAAKLSLHDSWADEPPEFRVGEPVTRTLTLEATGLEGSQLPALTFPDINGMRLYPEQPVQENRSDGKWVYGSSRQALAYVPSASGKLSIPEVRVDWWDTGTQQQRTAVLPAWEVNVLPGTAPASQPPPAPLPQPAIERTAPAAAAAPPESRWLDKLQQYWSWIAGAGLLAAAVIGLSWLAARSRRRPITPVSAADSRTAAATADRQQRGGALSALQQACSGNDPQAAARALLQLATVEWPADPPRNLAELERRLPVAAGPLRALERVLYAPGNAAWQGEELWQQFKNGLPAGHAVRVTTDPGLAPLYPDRDGQPGT